MRNPFTDSPCVAVACGGTGGHLFPGLAVAEQLIQRGCEVTLLISPKEVDQQAVRAARGMRVETLPAVGLTRGSEVAFLRGFCQSYRASRRLFESRPPHAALAMGGFTSAAPILAAKVCGAQTLLHESNTIPGRANRWLSWVVNRACVGFPSAACRLHNRSVTVTGTPVRHQFQIRDPASCRAALGLDPDRPVLLVMGGSQGATGINEIAIRTLPLLLKSAPGLQCVHITGPNDLERMTEQYALLQMEAVVQPFFARMELALGAATAAISRAGASSLAELAAMRLPSILVPYPAATDNHQFHNALAFVETGAAHLVEQQSATPETVAGLLLELIHGTPARVSMQSALSRWHNPAAAEQITDDLLAAIEARARRATGKLQVLDKAEPAVEQQRIIA
jgi:UDP-N-acetylglucosamine--N-acetylmuramyl-(pentapeptide) pyrophosphoryl-undecaprenol N-acetylglucosamine transferase